MQDAAVLSRLSCLDTCALSDALDKLRLPPAVTGICPQTLRRRICGRVMTVRLVAGVPAEGSTRHLCTTAIEGAGAGTVIVVEQRTGIDAAGWGGILSTAAKARGIEGVIIDGPARDIDEASALEFPVYARSVTARTARGRVYEEATGDPIVVGDVTVNSGDYVLADGSGIVLIGKENLEQVLEVAEEIAAREKAMTEAVISGHPVGQVMGARYEQMLEGATRP